MTPEGKVKKQILDYLHSLGCFGAAKAGAFPEHSKGWYFMPSQNGMGVKGIPDVMGHHLGRFFAIEAKAPGRKPSGFQKLQIEAIRASGGAVFVIDGDLSELQAYLEGE